MSEHIYFTIPFGDTSDPVKIGEKIAKDLGFSTWMVRIVRDEIDEGLISTKWSLEGWCSQ